ncbi:C4-dicarboxylate ABC transporter substrate-binding protein [Cryobacterium roopkundense]|uniref:C4-dicarboxylate ABC transporter substrate-binding protein n=1 Tax=Cryobacterium roopkundense TaxID=1001240 RepID=A0A099JC95_9MICO|nr:tripartite tricarboxylate transporter substrate-binding protein [Cryobacterium roopkundense]KGJ75700.1 C4-dicarboxylate ABC transporter substrate-binding protein [Cryobacterium roopkundense]MBB5641155.1 putative tricarboxylic transport membrane protein [Cryobacterium roopkundense]
MKLDPMTRRSAYAVAAAASVILLAACSTTAADTSSSTGIDTLNIVVPADPGGGWDQTGRAIEKDLQTNNLVTSASVVNIGGAGGTNGLASLKTEKDMNTLLVMGYVMVGAVETNNSANRIEDTTPIARLTDEPLVVVVPENSPYETIDDLLADINAQGQGVSITGGSAGGADHILGGMMLKAEGISADKLNYIPYSGGGESLAALLGNKVNAGISGVGEYAEQVKAGKLRALAVSGSDAAPQLPDVETLTDQGIDVVLTNWRGVVAPGTIDAAQAQKLTKLMEDLHASDTWKSTLSDNNWADAFMIGDEFATFLTDDIATVKVTLKDIGLLQ